MPQNGFSPSFSLSPILFLRVRLRSHENKLRPRRRRPPPAEWRGEREGGEATPKSVACRPRRQRGGRGESFGGFFLSSICCDSVVVEGERECLLLLLLRGELARSGGAWSRQKRRKTCSGDFIAPSSCPEARKKSKASRKEKCPLLLSTSSRGFITLIFPRRLQPQKVAVSFTSRSCSWRRSSRLSQGEMVLLSWPYVMISSKCALPLLYLGEIAITEVERSSRAQTERMGK